MDFGPYDILRGKGQKAEHGGKKVGGGPSRTQGQGQRQGDEHGQKQQLEQGLEHESTLCQVYAF